ncbi:unnamed protein product [Mytilus coruscus]|uniref:Uncharacterized protein n=1 Tax=Mytilus coruscus TaxID=42192 RepID=A0A6J8AKP1_MYTCO|nr:unnamed protein product [Mytilus coruscus]
MAYEILRKPAKEVLVTVISDLERTARGDDTSVHAVPIHYGLSGFSLPMKPVRNMLKQIVNAEHDRQLNTKAIAFDGQFMELAVEDDSERRSKEENKTNSTDIDCDILQYLPTAILSSLDDESIEILKRVGATESFNEENQSEATEQPNIQLNDEIYESALISLIANDKEQSKFNSYSLDEFKALFETAKNINDTFTVSQLKMLANILESVNFNKSALKRELVNLISHWYGNKNILDEQVKTPKKLKVLVKNHIKSWPIEAINVAYAQLNFLEAYDKRCVSNTFNGSWEIKSDTGNMFSISQ